MKSESNKKIEAIDGFFSHVCEKKTGDFWRHATGGIPRFFFRHIRIRLVITYTGWWLGFETYRTSCRWLKGMCTRSGISIEAPTSHGCIWSPLIYRLGTCWIQSLSSISVALICIWRGKSTVTLLWQSELGSTLKPGVDPACTKLYSLLRIRGSKK